ncbi:MULTISPECIES: response regulator transcription factor [Pseudanabaena]|uniref:Response regulator receiver protein n=2 Tax=Pseudanabaena TaxID=1152 RepID=L8N3Q1_9CYAN|nr:MULTISPECIES: response regulator transcription factor [Pseudanabaena]ELS32893.1 response regulator receiver protein [Pseudanabaena biceps PCC 7429]MDG3494863.1 response regulator transcription factor [Pseudanabaena catenata USMAC16]TYQ31067.1 response regulator [Pseudanabaena sp. UWO310]
MTSSTKTLRVLVVDDHELTRCTLQLALSLQSCIGSVEVANNGKEAISKVHKYKPDVVIMDLHMPVMDGWSASSAIKTEYPHIKIVAYSAADGGKAQAISNGAIIDAFCDKGACTRSLLEAIKSVA